jgi:hypothetical protein
MLNKYSESSALNAPTPSPCVVGRPEHVALGINPFTWNEEALKRRKVKENVEAPWDVRESGAVVRKSLKAPISDSVMAPSSRLCGRKRTLKVPIER